MPNWKFFCISVLSVVLFLFSRVEMDSSNRAPIIMFNTYITQFTCSNHGILIREKITTYLDAKGKSNRTCFLCEELFKTKTPDFTRRRLYERVKLFSIQHKIGAFNKDFYIQQIKKLDYHRSYYKILWKHHVSDVRHKVFESTPGDISTRSDYAERFGFDPDGQIHNELFDNNRSLSMECCCLDRFIKPVNVRSFYDNGGGGVHQSNDTVRKFYLHLSDSKLQNSATTKAHLHTLLAKFFEKKQMMRGRTMWDQTYGCAKQYRCSIAFFIWYLAWFLFLVRFT